MMNRIILILLSILTISCDKSKEIEYYDNGEIKYQVELDKDGRRNGVYKEYYEDGTLKTMWEYDHGVEHGDYKEFSKNGYLKVYGKMEHGDFTKSEGYDSLGNVFERRLYLNGSIYYVEKFNSKGEIRKRQLLPVFSSEKDTVMAGEERCITIDLGIKPLGDVVLTIGHFFEDKAQEIDTINFSGQSYRYCISSDLVGENEIRGYFDHYPVKGDTVSINAIAFERVFYVKADPNRKSI